jgi:hypothetical protein
MLSDTLVAAYGSHVGTCGSGGGMMLALTIAPPNRCSDGVRRQQILDYIDFLFPSPTIEDMIATAASTYPGTSGTITIQGNNLIFQVTT